MNMTARLEQGSIIFPGTRESGASRPMQRSPGARNASTVNRAATFTVTLAKWRTAVLATRGAVEIRCLSGQLWITQLGDSRDIVLQAGESHIVARAMRDMVLSTVGSQEPAALEIVPAGAARRGLQRLWQGGRSHFQLDIA